MRNRMFVRHNRGTSKATGFLRPTHCGCGLKLFPRESVPCIACRSEKNLEALIQAHKELREELEKRD